MGSDSDVCGVGVCVCVWMWESPFVVDAEARQSGNGVPLLQFLKTDYTLAGIPRQHVI